MSGGFHLDFELQPGLPSSRRTKIWNVVSQGEYRLGSVKWWAPWRRYTFFPDGDTLYDALCLRRIAEFCETETKARKTARRIEREAIDGREDN